MTLFVNKEPKYYELARKTAHELFARERERKCDFVCEEIRERERERTHTDMLHGRCKLVFQLVGVWLSPEK